MDLNDYEIVLYRNQPEGWVAEIPAIEGCYAVMPTRQEALAELERVFGILAAEKMSEDLRDINRYALATRVRVRRSEPHFPDSVVRWIQ